MKRLLLLFALAVVAMSCGNHCPSNEIWYTSADGNIVEPYSSGEGSQDNFTVFGANIVSNKYDADKDCWVITFDGDVTIIGEWAFSDCRSLTSVTIPDSVTTIEDYAFYECSSLTSVTIPDSVTSIGEWAFSDCRSLTSVTIPDGVTTIGYAAFLGCSSLTSVTIPDSVTTIGEVAFYGCYNLTSVYCKAITPPTVYFGGYGDWNAFDGNASNRKIYVPMESMEAYKSAEYWSDYADYIVGYEF